MVSSVFVELVRDGDEAPSRTTEAGEVGKTISGSDVASGIGKEDIFCMEIKVRHVSLSRVLKLIAWGTGERGTAPKFIKTRYNITRVFLLGDTTFCGLAPRQVAFPIFPIRSVTLTRYCSSNMPSRSTRSTTRKNTSLRPTPVFELQPGVRRQRNGIVIDASICSSFGNWKAPDQEEEGTKDPEVLDEADGSGGSPSDAVTGGGQTV